MVFAWMWDYLKAEGKISIVGLVITEVLMIRAYMAGYEDSIFREYRINAVLLAVTGSVMVLCVLTLGFCRKQSVRRAITGCLILMLGINVISEGGITYTDRICLKKTDTPEEQMDAQTVAFNERQQAEDEETAAGAMFARPQAYYRELYSQDVQDTLAYLKETDPEFYRVEKDYSAGTISMDSLAQNYRGISTYNSVMNGNIKGTVIATSTFEGKWSANAKNNSFKATVTTAGNYGNDQLARNFIEGLNAATSYEGDSNNLYLLYKPASGKQTFRMVFRVVSNK